MASTVLTETRKEAAQTDGLAQRAFLAINALYAAISVRSKVFLKS